jgi:hypothetical protein
VPICGCVNGALASAYLTEGRLREKTTAALREGGEIGRHARLRA